jgi:hypothetical protein
MIDHVHAFALPAAYAVLPSRMASPHATAMLLAIGAQESGFAHRRQVGGPARGFWQFERGGAVHGLLTHELTRPLLDAALRALRFEHALGLEAALQNLIECNDVVAAVCARLLLSTVPQRLPQRGELQMAWEQYAEAWRPGTPRRATWDAHYLDAWRRVARAAQETRIA